MAYPEGYCIVTWDDVAKSSTIHEVYILQDGRDQPYGPYKVVDAARHMVEDPKAIYDKQFPVLPHEVIGVKVPVVQQLTIGGAFVSPTTPTPTLTTTTEQAVAAQIFDLFFEAFTTQIASKSLAISQATRQKLEQDASVKRNVAVKALADALKR